MQGWYPEETKSEKYTRNPKFTAALFTIARTWKKPRYPSTDEWIKNLCSRCTHMRALYLSMYIKIYNGILLSHKKEHSWVSPNEVDEATAYYTEWSKSKREKQLSYTNAYIWNLESSSNWWTYLQGNNRDADLENRLMDTVGKEVDGMNWEWH